VFRRFDHKLHTSWQQLDPTSEEKPQFDLSLLTTVTNHRAHLKNHKPAEEMDGEKRSSLLVFFDISKKTIDIIDDVWCVMRSIIPMIWYSLIGQFLTGGVGSLIHSVEAYQGFKEALAAFNNKKLAQRKTRGAAGLITFALGCTGAGLSISLIASAFGASVSGAMTIPVLIPTLLISIYVTALIKRSYIFSQYHKLENLTEKRLLALEKTTVSTVEELMKHHTQIEMLKESYNHYREERLRAERNMAFSAFEVFASVFILIGTIMSISTFIAAATMASFGLAPLILLVIGVALGLSCKIFEYADEKHHFQYTRRIRNWFLEQWYEKSNSNNHHLALAPTSTTRISKATDLGDHSELRTSALAPTSTPKQPSRPKQTNTSVVPVSVFPDKSKQHREKPSTLTRRRVAPGATYVD
jgi:hypothetical protein